MTEKEYLIQINELSNFIDKDHPLYEICISLSKKGLVKILYTNEGPIGAALTAEGYSVISEPK